MKTKTVYLLFLVMLLISCHLRNHSGNPVMTKQDSLNLATEVMNRQMTSVYLNNKNIPEDSTSGLKIGDAYINSAPFLVGKLIVLNNNPDKTITLNTLPLYVLRSEDDLSTSILNAEPEFQLYTATGFLLDIDALSQIVGNFKTIDILKATYKTIYSSTAKQNYMDLELFKRLNREYKLKEQFGEKLKVINSITVKEFEVTKLDSLSTGIKGSYTVVNIDGKLFFNNESSHRVRQMFITYDEIVYPSDVRGDMPKIKPVKFNKTLKVESVTPINFNDLKPK